MHFFLLSVVDILTRIFATRALLYGEWSSGNNGVSERNVSRDTWMCVEWIRRISSIMRNNKTNVKNKERSEKGNDESKRREKTFDKKKYRLQKYSNKYKSMYRIYIFDRLTWLLIQHVFTCIYTVNQLEEKRKKAVLRGFYKELKKDEQTSNLETTIKNTHEEAIKYVNCSILSSCSLISNLRILFIYLFIIYYSQQLQKERLCFSQSQTGVQAQSGREGEEDRRSCSNKSRTRGSSEEI